MILKKFPFFLFDLTFWRFINHHFLFYRCIHTNTIDINEVSKIRWDVMINIGGVHQLKFYRRYFLKYSHTKKWLNFQFSLYTYYMYLWLQEQRMTGRHFDAKNGTRLTRQKYNTNQAIEQLNRLTYAFRYITNWFGNLLRSVFSSKRYNWHFCPMNDILNVTNYAIILEKLVDAFDFSLLEWNILNDKLNERRKQIFFPRIHWFLHKIC